MLKSGASNSQAPTCNGLNVRDRHKRRHEDKRTPSLFSSPLLSPFGHKRWVSTRGKCSNSPISLLERAPLLPTLLLCLSALAVLISFLILPSLFDLRRRGGGGGGCRSALLTPRGANNLSPCFPIMPSVHRAHLAQGHLFTAKLTLFTRKCLAKRTEPPR